MRLKLINSLDLYKARMGHDKYRMFVSQKKKESLVYRYKRPQLHIAEPLNAKEDACMRSIQPQRMLGR